MKISLVVSTRDNLKYLKWSYDSIRKNQGDHEVHICYGIDHCTDGTQEWVEEIKKTDPLVKSIENTSGKRLGHTIMYDRIVNEIVETDIAMIFHSDMYLCPNAIDVIEYFMYKPQNYLHAYGLGYPDLPVKNQIISLTRIEPPLHPAGPEKIVQDFGIEPENFNENGLAKYLKFLEVNEKIARGATNGVFAPWAFWVDEFKAIGGHDPLFAPQSKEDSDIFNRFKLNGCEFIQTWRGFVYHLTSRGSRFNPNITQVGTNSPEWEEQNLRSTRNFIRKWGAMVRHDEYLHPIVPHKYNIGFVVKNCNPMLLAALEIWCDTIVTDLPYEVISQYIATEQQNTSYKLTNRVHPKITEVPEVIVEIDGHTLRQDDFNAICYLSDILTDSGEIGEMELGNLKLNIKALNHYENELIVCPQKIDSEKQ
jgi:glycosyltransferase involved in cell wall biosynthesis